MASQKNFAITPSVSITRSKFKRPSQHKTSFNLGDIVPIYVDSDILPGDTVSLDLASLVRMSTPIAPIMDNIYVDYYAFFVPHRLVWDDWKLFMGENTSTYGAATEPIWSNVLIGYGNDGTDDSVVVPGSIGDHLGLPCGVLGEVVEGVHQGLYVSTLPGRSYFLIYNEWFRDQNIISPIDVSKASDVYDSIGFYPDGSDIFYSDDLLKAAKNSDYFTRALPYAQKGAAVTLPLGTTAPLTMLDAAGEYEIANSDNVNPMLSIGTIGGFISGNEVTIDGANLYSEAQGSFSRLAVDLTNATAATINQLRFAFQYQKFLEKDALYGTRYWEILKGHFGITAPDASLQRPEFLGHFRQHINIDQVLQTSETDTTALGTPGANSVSGKSGHLISKSFVEHGTLMILAVARHDQTYGQGINRMWTREHRKDYYFPVFANLGAQEIKNKEIYAAGNKPEGTFGFQEAWAEYRYKPNQVSGILNPSVANSLGFWTLANNFGSLPTLSKSFIEQDRANLARALVTGEGGPDFIADFYFDATYVRPMPMYSLPGLIDHH